MEVEGVILNHYFLQSDFTDEEIKLILEVQLFNRRRVLVQINKNVFNNFFEQFSQLEECGVGQILEINGSNIYIIFETVQEENMYGKYTTLKPIKIKHYPKNEWIDLK